MMNKPEAEHTRRLMLEAVQEMGPAIPAMFRPVLLTFLRTADDRTLDAMAEGILQFAGRLQGTAPA